MSKYGVNSGPYFHTFGLDTERYGVSLRIQSEHGKIRTRNNTVFGHFSHSHVHQNSLNWLHFLILLGGSRFFLIDFIILIHKFRSLSKTFLAQLDSRILRLHMLHKKCFPLRISSVNVTKSVRNCGFYHTY